ncbi:uncharacterized protein LOC143284820 isoform X2 [Babylonia areolata]|uniref:uncharacterized protein LOC143284820 isoform X2 n=1 Tax=Babylonia areolata TaxID=304850 RepID=UPI003FD56713
MASNRAVSLVTSVVLCVLFTGCNGGEFCTTIESDGSESSTYCPFGCCGTYPNQECCGASVTGVVVGGAVAGVILLSLIITGIIKSKGRPGQVVQQPPPPPPPTVTTV